MHGQLVRLQLQRLHGGWWESEKDVTKPDAPASNRAVLETGGVAW